MKVNSCYWASWPEEDIILLLSYTPLARNRLATLCFKGLGTWAKKPRKNSINYKFILFLLTFWWQGEYYRFSFFSGLALIV